jgi:hypothetical protein
LFSVVIVYTYMRVEFDGIGDQSSSV